MITGLMVVIVLGKLVLAAAIGWALAELSDDRPPDGGSPHPPCKPRPAVDR
jgi:hypothetical protein